MAYDILLPVARRRRRRRARVVVHVPAGQAASLRAWLENAAVVAEVGATGVVIPRWSNRPFHTAAIVELVREWMQRRRIGVVLATSDDSFLAIVSPRGARHQPHEEDLR
jgi:hypothetical protein